VTRSAFVLGGTGQVGRAIAARLAETAWEVTIGSRGEKPLAEGFRHVRIDRREGIGAADGADLVVDVIPYTAADAEQLLELDVGALIAISSVAAYNLDFSRLPCPIPETYPTVKPGEDGYACAKVAMERALLEQDETPATVLRPSAIHGPHAPILREWYFVKRALDSRPAIILSYEGKSINHTTSVANLCYGLERSKVNRRRRTARQAQHAPSAQPHPPEPRQTTRRPQPAPNFIPGIAPRSGPSFPLLGRLADSRWSDPKIEGQIRCPGRGAGR
jgi:nucleoside-diphosphate-sugar epimerase